MIGVRSRTAVIAVHELQIDVLVDVVADRFRVCIGEAVEHDAWVSAARAPNAWAAAVGAGGLIVL
jgi:hypothetical protein